MVEGILVKAFHIIVYPILAFAVGVFFAGFFRKISARIHRRYGPPVLQPLIDVLRFFSQKSISHGKVFNGGLVFALAGTLTVLMFIPFGRICPFCSSGGLLVVLYLLIITPLSVALSGGEGANPNISIGISRKLIVSFAYEVPLLMIVLALMLYYQTTSLSEIVKLQQKYGWSIYNLKLLIPGIAYLLILPVMLGMRPFDVVSAPQEIASGPIVEYGGRCLALYHIEHVLHMFIGLALYVDLFLGGGTNIVFFFIKLLVLFFLLVLINAIFPRYRTDQVVRYLWKWPGLISFIGLMIVRLTVK